MPRGRPRNTDADDALGGDGMTALEGEGAEQRRAAPDDDNDKDVDSFLSEFGGEAAYVMLRRFESGEWVILDRLDVGAATSVAIKERYGGGKYRARVVNEMGQHGRQITFKMAGKPKYPDDDDDKSEKKDEFTERLDRLEKLITDRANPNESGRDRLMEAVVTRLVAPTPPPSDNNMKLMEVLITALIAGKPNTSGIDPVELQKLLQGARSEGYTQGKELGEALAISTGDADASVGSVLARQLPELTKILANAQQSHATTTRRRIPNPIPTATSLPATQPTTETDTVTSDNPIAKYLKPVVPLVIKWARAGKSAEVKAVNMLDDLTDAQRATIGGLAEEEDFVATVMSAVPEFNAPDVREWIALFLTTVQNTLAPVVDDTDAPQIPTLAELDAEGEA